MRLDAAAVVVHVDRYTAGAYSFEGENVQHV